MIDYNVMMMIEGTVDTNNFEVVIVSLGAGVKSGIQGATGPTPPVHALFYLPSMFLDGMTRGMGCSGSTPNALGISPPTDLTPRA